MTRHSLDHSQRSDADSAQLGRLRAERDAPRCGLCGTASTRPVCGRCDAILGRELAKPYRPKRTARQ